MERRDSIDFKTPIGIVKAYWPAMVYSYTENNVFPRINLWR